MYLSDKLAGKPRSPSEHEELELLLESFSKQVEEIKNESETSMVINISTYDSPTLTLTIFNPV